MVSVPAARFGKGSEPGGRIVERPRARSAAAYVAAEGAVAAVRVARAAVAAAGAPDLRRNAGVSAPAASAEAEPLRNSRRLREAGEDGSGVR